MNDDPAVAPLTDLQPSRAQILDEVLQGLSACPPRLPSRLFYDAEGSALFEAITRTPEYYLTRTELALLGSELPAIAARVGPQAHVVELGSGSGRKTACLLAGLQDPVAYTPVEISRQALLDSLHSLTRQIPGVEMLPVCADFTQPFAIPPPARAARRRLLFFPGSTLGNFEPAAATALLRGMASLMQPQGLALVGIDLDQDPSRIQAAYNDADGVTAAFTLNLLRRLNRELGSDFNLEGFSHRARYDRDAMRIQTDIVSRERQRVHLSGRVFEFAAGDAIGVEYSHKYSRQSLAALAGSAGLEVRDWWQSTAPDFALCLLSPR